ncbi:MAG: hypothetical protein R3E87_04730 [Burkholderiaceae bacterium]
MAAERSLRALGEIDRLLHFRQLDRLLLLDREQPNLAFQGDACLLERAIRGDARLLHGLTGVDFGFLDCAFPADLKILQGLLALDPGLLQRPLGRDSRLLDLLVGEHLGLLEGLPLGDLEILERALALDARLVEFTFLGDARSIDRETGFDLGLACLGARGGHVKRLLREGDLALALADLVGSATFDLEPLLFLRSRDALTLQRQLDRDAFTLNVLLAANLGLVDGLAAGDFASLGLFFVGDARLGQRARLGDATLLDFFARRQLRLLGLLLAQCPFTGKLRLLDRAPDLDLAFLFDTRVLALAIDLQDLLLGLQVAVADLHQGLLLDVVALPASRFDGFREQCQALGVEDVARVEVLGAGLIEIGQCHRFEIEAVVDERLASQRRHPLHVFAALLVHFLERHGGSHGPQRAGELGFEEIADAIRLHGAAAQRLGGQRYGLGIRADADEKLGGDVDAHSVAGDQRIVLGAAQTDAHGVHVDRSDLMQHGHDEGAVVDRDPLAEKTSAHERRFLGRAPVQPSQQIDRDRDHDDEDDQPKDQVADGGRVH